MSPVRSTGTKSPLHRPITILPTLLHVKVPQTIPVNLRHHRIPQVLGEGEIANPPETFIEHGVVHIPHRPGDGGSRHVQAGAPCVQGQLEAARIRAHYRTCLASGDKKSQGQNRAPLAGMFFFWRTCFAVSFDWSMSPLSLASLIVACGAEADVLDPCCGIRGEYHYGKDKAEALLAQEEGVCALW